SAVFTTLLAFLLSFAINRGCAPRPALMRGLLLLPLVAPPVLVASALVMLFGRRGLITSGLLDRTLGVIDAEATNFYGLAGVIIAQIIAFLPAALIVLDDVMRKQDGRLEEAAASLGSSRTGVFWRVTLPMTSPGLRRVAVLAFIMSLTDFGNPLILGRDTPVLAGLIYEEVTAFRNTPLAAALCVWLLVPPLLIFLGLEAMGGRRRFAAVEGGQTRAEARLPASLRWPLAGLCVAVAGLIVVIYLTVIAGAFVRFWGVDWTPTLGFFTSGGVNVGFQGTGYGSSDRGLGSVWSSFGIALAAAVPGAVLGLLTAVVVERIRPPGHHAIAFLAMIPAILPGIIFGVGYIVAFHVPFGIKELSLTGTGAILAINIAFGNLFVGMLAARAALQRADPALDEAGENLGAGMLLRLWMITLPLMKPALLLGALYVFVDGLTTLSSVIFLISGDHKLAAVSIFNHANSGEFGYAAAKSLMLLLFAGAAMLVVWRLEQGGKTRGQSDGTRRVTPFLHSGSAV
ncbi:MAG: ABC transporter permease, partial [Beijerinckiaceae bacterium]